MRTFAMLVDAVPALIVFVSGVFESAVFLCASCETERAAVKPRCFYVSWIFVLAVRQRFRRRR